VLINGAAGGVGTFAVQIAKYFGAEVTGICSTKNVDMVRSLGGDHVIDYTREDISTGGLRYDLILDLVANYSFSSIRRALNPKGIYIGVGMVGRDPSVSDIMSGQVNSQLLSRFVSQKFISFIAKSKHEDLSTLAELMVTGRVTPIIDRRFSLTEVPDAVRYVAEGHARGKVIITFGP
jgi:NADPH:quinone reductase-like Zn-dependent oxidoreductase